MGGGVLTKFSVHLSPFGWAEQNGVRSENNENQLQTTKKTREKIIFFCCVLINNQDRIGKSFNNYTAV